jgi:hypothetical protein
MTIRGEDQMDLDKGIEKIIGNILKEMERQW